jgi:hypothetical protein
MRYLLAATAAAFLLVVLGGTGGCNKTPSKTVEPNTNVPAAPKNDPTNAPSKAGVEVPK